MLYRRRLHSPQIDNNNKIVYIGSSKVKPAVLTEWGAEYNDLKSTFNQDTGVGKIVFDGEIIRIPNSAFKQLSELKSIVSMPQTVTVIRASSFRFDEADTTLRSNLESFTFHEGLTAINERSFCFCRKLTEVKLPNTIKTLGYRVFYKCTGLTKITFGENLTKFHEDDSTTTANNGSDFLYGCTSLTTIQWNAIECPDFLNSNYTPFTPDLPINTVKFGSKVKYIPSYIFFKCEGIKSITIPESCTSIGDRAFQGCSGLTKVTVKATNPPKIVPGLAAYGGGFTAGDGKNCVFRYHDGSWKILPKLTSIYVPADSVSKYKNDANWGIYSSIIKAIS